MEHKGAETIGGWRRWSRWLCVPLALALGSLLLAAPTPTMARAAGPLILHVTSTADTGGSCSRATLGIPPTCTLRQAVNASNANDPGLGGRNKIAITVTGTILLGSALPELGKNVEIVGEVGGLEGAIVDGGHAVRVFAVGSGVTATIGRLIIVNGNAGGGHNGGGILNVGTLTVTYCLFSGNSASYGGEGGGIANSGTLTVSNTTLTGNSAGSGGGIANHGALTVSNTTLSGNSTDFAEGGGILNWGTLALTNSTFSGNRAGNASAGGGIDNIGALDVTNTTLAGNSAGNGGGIYNQGTLHLTNTIVANNSATGTGPDIGSVNGVAPTTGHNLIGTTSGTTGITNGTNGDIVTATPHLGALARNGGLTPTIALLSGSPAINAGNDTVCAGEGPVGVNNKDQRGITRSGNGAHCDIGAFEMTAPIIPVWSSVGNSPNLPTPTPVPCADDAAWCRAVNTAIASALGQHP